jgi:hypothetical protein
MWTRNFPFRKLEMLPISPRCSITDAEKCGSIALRALLSVTRDKYAVGPHLQIHFGEGLLPLTTHLYLSLWLYSPLDLGRFFSFLIYTQSVGLLGRGISPLQGRYLHTEQHKQKHPCLKSDSNPRPHCSSGRRRFMHYATSREVAGSITYEVIRFCNWP